MIHIWSWSLFSKESRPSWKEIWLYKYKLFRNRKNPYNQKPRRKFSLMRNSKLKRNWMWFYIYVSYLLIKKVMLFYKLVFSATIHSKKHCPLLYNVVQLLRKLCWFHWWFQDPSSFWFSFNLYWLLFRWNFSLNCCDLYI